MIRLPAWLISDPRFANSTTRSAWPFPVIHTHTHTHTHTHKHTHTHTHVYVRVYVYVLSQVSALVSFLHKITEQLTFEKAYLRRDEVACGRESLVRCRRGEKKTREKIKGRQFVLLKILHIHSILQIHVHFILPISHYMFHILWFNSTRILYARERESEGKREREPETEYSVLDLGSSVSRFLHRDRDTETQKQE
jgi:hypothetical protein